MPRYDAGWSPLSNFYAGEDRELREIVVHLGWHGAKSVAGKADISADAFLYRIAVM